TGVQTCALPIYEPRAGDELGLGGRAVGHLQPCLRALRNARRSAAVRRPDAARDHRAQIDGAGAGTEDRARHAASRRRRSRRPRPRAHSRGPHPPGTRSAPSPGDDDQPAFSPDGSLIAFHSGRDSGGIFVMGRTGEAVRRVTRFGYKPAWSPDGTELALVTENVEFNPQNSESRGELW